MNVKINDSVKRMIVADLQWRLGTVVAIDGSRAQVLWTEQWSIPTRWNGKVTKRIVSLPTGAPATMRSLKIKTWVAVDSLQVV
jgi:hypothetical protein